MADEKTLNLEGKIKRLHLIGSGFTKIYFKLDNSDMPIVFDGTHAATIMLKEGAKVKVYPRLNCSEPNYVLAEKVEYIK